MEIINKQKKLASIQQAYKPTKITYLKIFLFLSLSLIFLSYTSYVIANKYAPKLFEKLASELEQNQSANPQIQENAPTPSNQLNKPKIEVTKSVTTKITNTITVINTPKPTLIPTISVKTETETIKPFCTDYKITNPKFASNKCYVQNDYSQLANYLGDYSMQEFIYNAAKDTQKFTCTGEEFFKEQCNDAKKRADSAKNKMKELENKINTIISRGR